MLKVLVAPGAVRFASAVREESPAHHVFGWLLGTSTSSTLTVLAALNCVEYASVARIDDRTALSLPHFSREFTALRAMLPAGLEVVGCFASSVPAVLAAALPSIMKECGLAPNTRFLAATLDLDGPDQG
jgi:hypothetical protein